MARQVLNLARVDSEDAYAVVRATMKDPTHKQQLAAAITILRLTGAFRAADIAAEAEDTVEAKVLPAQGYSTADLMAAAKGDA